MADAYDGDHARTRSTLHVNNLHCQSCVASITDLIAALGPPPADLEKGAAPAISDVAVSLADHNVSFTHAPALGVRTVLQQLDAAGFDVWLDSHSLLAPEPAPARWAWLRRPFAARRTRARESAHRAVCAVCRAPEASPADTVVEPAPAAPPVLHETRLAVAGMSCSSCTASLSAALAPAAEAGVHACTVTLLPPAAVVVHDPELVSAADLKALVEDIGYSADVVSSAVLAAPPALDRRTPTAYKAIFSVLGMTCVSCVSSVSHAMESVPGTTAVSVDLLGKAASALVQDKGAAELVCTEVEDVGFECSIVEVVPQYDDAAAPGSEARTVRAEVGGMFCEECVAKVNGALARLAQAHALSFTPVTLAAPATDLTYMPAPPAFTLRHVRAEIEALGFSLAVVHPDSIEARSARARERERRHLLVRLAVAFVFAVPTFVVAVVGMSLLPAAHPLRARLEAPVWGNASRGTVAAFALATPVQFGVGAFFYARAWAGLRGVWRARRAGADRRRVWRERLLRWGSMDSLVALGTSVGYAASLAMMALDVAAAPQGAVGGEMGWFDSSVFLMLFILAGRYLESVSKQRTGDAIAALAATKPSTGLLWTPEGAVEERADFLEVGDTLLVPAGASPPLDAVLAPASARTTFDEAALTGEARPVLKAPGDAVFAGTTNAGPAAARATVSHAAGHTMLDGIVGAVRDAMGKKARIERIADTVTAYFVPAVVAAAALTFAVWCVRGYVGALPAEWLGAGARRGGWALFAVQFGVAVLVVACPCGIGLAAPTAQLVGVGLAAQHGVLANGGGEAFQTIAAVDTVVLDKTGTLTTGAFAVADHRLFGDAPRACALLRAAEEASTHPLAAGVRAWCAARAAAPAVELVAAEERAGRGLVATLAVDGAEVEVAIGNEALMRDVGAAYRGAEDAAEAARALQAWQEAGMSVVLLSAREAGADAHVVLGALGVHDAPREEAAALVAELRRLKMAVWMVSGDNATTARAVARAVGIDAAHVVAGALPVDKQRWVRTLQADGGRKRGVVAFVGDGINDAPALAQADVGLAMGGGAAVAVATADFCLLGTNLLALATVHDVARATRRKIVSNFVWACLYNAALLPLAAGAFYALGRTRLPPVWGAAAMALSSVSVVVNSLFLRWTYRPPRVVRAWARRAEGV